MSRLSAEKPAGSAGAAEMPAPPAPDQGGYAGGGREFVSRLARRFALRELHLPAEWRREAVLYLALGAALGWIGPYGTYDRFALGERLLYWMVALPLIGIPARLAILGVRRGARSAAWPVPLQAIAGSVLAGFPASFVIVALLAAFGRLPRLSGADLAALYGSATVLIILISTPLTMLRARQAPTRQGEGVVQEQGPAAALSAAGPAESPFLRRIPGKLGSELLYIATEDHYLRVVTPLGSDLILFRMADAVAELDPTLGQQVHRSYWVARRAVSRIERDGHRLFLHLADGTRLPVSRTYVPALREAGWLAG